GRAGTAGAGVDGTPRRRTLDADDALRRPPPPRNRPEPDPGGRDRAPPRRRRGVLRGRQPGGRRLPPAGRGAMSDLDRTVPPAPGPLRPFHVPPIDRRVVAGGVPLFI